MANKLKNIHLTKVDFVDEGANQRADIKLTKRNDDSAPDGVLVSEEFSHGLLSSVASAVRKFLKGETVEKTASSFKEQLTATSADDISNEVWKVLYALRTALDSVVYDTEADAAGKTAAMTESMAQFSEAMQEYIPKWCSGKSVELKKSLEVPGAEELEIMKKDHESLGEAIEKASNTKGELEDMLKIDKSKMTPEERAAYDEMIKKFAVEVEDEPGEGVQKANTKKADPEEDEVVEEEGEKKTKKSRTSEQESSSEGAELLKGVIADLKSEIASLKETAITNELAGVAKKYEPLGKKTEEVVETLKKAKQAGIYDEVIAAYDSALSAQEASGIFGEIGKSRSGAQGSGEAEAIAKANAKVAELRKNNPNLTEAQALDQVLLNDAELRKEFDQ